MFDGRIYRAAFVPLLLVLAIAGFSLASRPVSLHSTLAPDAFNGARAFSELETLAKRYPDRRPGSVGDDRLAAYIAATLRALNGPAGGGLQVSIRRFHAQTVDGARTLTSVIAERPGSTGMRPIAIVAHRDSAARGSPAELSGTAALLELARVFSQSETRRTIVLVSTSGGSGGDGGVSDFVEHGIHPLDAAIVLGDIAGTHARKPFVLPFSSAIGNAPESLQRTLADAVSQEAGANPGTPGAVAQLAHLAFPLATGEEAPFNAVTVPAVLVQVSGEPGPSPGVPVSQARLLGFGRAVLSATYALDEGQDIAASSSTHILLGRQTLPGWTIRLLVLALLLAPLLVGIDAFARLRRRREPVLRWVLWTLTAALPFFTCALFVIALGALGIIAAPGSQPSAASLSVDGSLAGALVSAVLVLTLALLAYPALVRRFGLELRPCADGAALAVLLVLLVIALLTWLFNPFACLLLVPALHLWLAAVELARESSVRARVLALAAILAGALPLVMLLLAYALELELGPVGLAESVVLVLAGGHVGLLGALIWSGAFGCLLAVMLLAPPPRVMGVTGSQDWVELSTRGPASYAGPGSLGGTESALRR
jgi:hypothetical protein